MKKVIFAIVFALAAARVSAQQVPFFTPMRFVRTDAQPITVINSIAITGVGITVTGSPCLSGACAFTLTGGAAGGSVSLQGSTPGTADTGNSNISGYSLAGRFYVPSGGIFGWTSLSRLSTATDGIITMANFAGNDFTRLNFGGNGSANVGLATSGTTLSVTRSDATASSSDFAVTGGLRLQPVNKTSNFTMAQAGFYTVTAAAGNVTATLPAATGTGQVYYVQRTDASGNIVTIAGAGSDLINGQTSRVLTMQNQWIELVDAASAAWSVQAQGPVTPVNSYMRLQDDFCGDRSGITSTQGDMGGWAVTNTGTAVNPGNQGNNTTGQDANHQCMLTLETGTTTTGESTTISRRSSSANVLLLSGGESLTWLVYLSNLSTTAEEYTARAGFCDSTDYTTDCTDGAYFEYHDTTAAATPNWAIKTASNTTRTSADCTIAVTATTWHALTVTLTDSTHAAFTVDGVQCTNSPITTNIPTGAGRYTGIMSGIVKNAGTTNRTISMDAMEFVKPVAR